MPGRREVHVVLRGAGPGAAPAPPDRAEGIDDSAGHHPTPVPGAVAVGQARGVARLATADVRVLDRVDVDRETVRVHRPAARAVTAGAGRGHGLAAREGPAYVAVGGA